MAEHSTDDREKAKAQMRAALERKHAHEHAGNRGERNTGAVHGSQLTPSEGWQVYRRKTG